MKRLLLIILFAYLGYEGYELYIAHRDPAFKVYEAFSRALIDNDNITLKSLSTPAALKDLSSANAYAKRYEGKIRWVYHRILTTTLNTPAEKTFRIKQIVRLDPPGSSTFWGQSSISSIHIVTLQDEHGQWKVSQFNESR